MLVQKARAETCIWETAFGDASIADAESVPRRFILNTKYMSYEAEQEQFAKELESVKSRFEDLDNYFKQNPSEKEKRSGYSFGSDSVVENYQRQQYERILIEKYFDSDNYNCSTLYLEYKICKYRMAELQAKLKESETSRNISKTVDYIGSITPQHVSGRVYKVENGDGCGKFCLWFLIIDAFIIFLYWIISGGH